MPTAFLVLFFLPVVSALFFLLSCVLYTYIQRTAHCYLIIFGGRLTAAAASCVYIIRDARGRSHEPAYDCTVCSRARCASKPRRETGLLPLRRRRVAQSCYNTPRPANFFFLPPSLSVLSILWLPSERLTFALSLFSLSLMCSPVGISIYVVLCDSVLESWWCIRGRKSEAWLCGLKAALAEGCSSED